MHVHMHVLHVLHAQCEPLLRTADEDLTDELGESYVPRLERLPSARAGRLEHPLHRPREVLHLRPVRGPRRWEDPVPPALVGVGHVRPEEDRLAALEHVVDMVLLRDLGHGRRGGRRRRRQVDRQLGRGPWDVLLPGSYGCQVLRRGEQVRRR